jgi:hypothetical protein
LVDYAKSAGVPVEVAIDTAASVALIAFGGWIGIAARRRMRLSQDVRVPTASVPVPHFRARSHEIDLFACAQTYFAHSLSGRLTPSVHVRTPM